MPTRGFSIRIYLPQGDPSGVRVIGKTTSTVQGLVFPRAMLSQAVEERSELVRHGVYLLWGQDESLAFPRLYVGQTDNLAKRLGEHVKDEKKDFWTDTVALFSSDDSMTSTHVRYLESRLIDLARDSTRCDLANEKRATQPPIIEADRDDAENFLDDILICLPLAGLRVLLPEQASSGDSTDSPTTDFPLKMQVVGIEARGSSRSDGFLVAEGSGARRDITESMRRREFKGYLNLRQTLIEEGVLRQESDRFRFSMDHLFKSPSAATFVIGGTPSPYDAWKDESGKSLRDIQAEVERAAE